MFKSSLSICALLLFNLSTQAQDTYFVTSILGTIINKTEKDTLKEESLYSSTDRLSFSGEEDFMGVVDQDGNTFMVMLDPEEDTILYEAIPFAEGGRTGMLVSSIDVILHFAEDTRYLILGDATQIEFSPYSFPMNVDTFFYVKYTYPDLDRDGKREVIAKQLSYDSTFLNISMEELFKAKYEKPELMDDAAPGDTILVLDPSLVSDFQFLRYTTTIGRGAHLTFYDPQQPDEKQNRKSIPFNPVFLNHPGLVNEVSVLYQSIQKKWPDNGPKSHLQSIKEYIENKYQGQVYFPNLEAWMRKQNMID